MRIPLGSFILQEIIGKGGMGDVWLGRHVEQDTPVAVKVITSSLVGDSKYLLAFRNEVRAAARLDHPSIIMVFDHGSIPRDADLASHGRLVEGSPYLVMEYASAGALDRVSLPMVWSDLKILLLLLLDALAHSHARGLVHRDLKPANVLFSNPQDDRPGIKLTDFGIAHALDSKSDDWLSRGSVGTPNYMAPEQFMGHWRDFGPWTDLYALGCLAYTLSTGARPFKGKEHIDIARAHLKRPPLPIGPTRHLPKGWEGWLHRLLQKNPRHRFRRAADAAIALLELGEPAEKREPMPGPRPPLADHFTQLIASWAGTGMMDGERGAASLDLPSADQSFKLASFRTAPESSYGRSKLCQIPQPVIPDTWQRREQPQHSIALVGAGLGLYGLRPIPLVNRHEELNRIWGTLQGVQRSGSPKAIVLTGSAGLGKSRLVHWIGERAHELGGVEILKAFHGPIPGPGNGLSRMIARQLGCVGLSRDETFERTSRILNELGSEDEYEAKALTALMSPDSSEDGEEVRFTNDSQRYRLLIHLLELLARERPLIVWLEDVQWGSDAIAFMRFVLEHPPRAPLPVLFLATLREDALNERPLEKERLQELYQSNDASSLPIQPLSGDHQWELVRNLLFLDESLANQVAARTGGNPLFAVQLVGDWVRRRVLELGRAGFTLRAGEKAELPDDIHGMWVNRIDGLLDEIAQTHPSANQQEELRNQDYKALELAAVLGREVIEGEWILACCEAGLSTSSELIERLISSHLAEHTESGWAFVHNMLHESLERIARQSGHWQQLNRYCATMLDQGYPGRPKGITERLAGHLVESGELTEAVTPLLTSAKERLKSSHYQQAILLLEQRDGLLEKLGVQPDDFRRPEGWLARAQILYHQTDFDGALSWTERAAQAAQQAQHDELLAECLITHGCIAQWRGEYLSALQALEQARQLFNRLKNPQGYARCQRHLAAVRRERGQLELALPLIEEATSISKRLHDWDDWTDCLNLWAQIHMAKGLVDQGADLAQQALTVSQRDNYLTGELQAWRILGDAWRHKGQLAEAEEVYQKVQEVSESLGIMGRILLPRLNLALIELQNGEYLQARSRLEVELDLYHHKGLRGLLSLASCMLLPCFAYQRDWSSYDQHVFLAQKSYFEIQRIEPDAAWCLELAGHFALEAEADTRARNSYALAAAMWRTLGVNERAAAIEERMSRRRGGRT